MVLNLTAFAVVSLNNLVHLQSLVHPKKTRAGTDRTVRTCILDLIP